MTHCKLCNTGSTEILCPSCFRCEEKRVEVQNKRKNSKETLKIGEWLSCLEKHNYACKGCKKSLVLLTLDHIISLHKGGKNIVLNIQPLCSECHEIKGTVETKMMGNKKKREEGKEMRNHFSSIFNE